MKAYILFLIIFLFSFSCKQNDDVFAIFNEGNITRLEFNDWLESRNILAESVFKDKYSMTDYLRQMAVEKLTAIKAEKEGYANDKSYKTVENTLYKNLLATYFTDNKSRDIIFNEKAADVSIIRVFLKQDISAEASKENENKKRIIYFLLEQLNSGKDFNDLAGKYSEDAASKKNGHLGIIPENAMEDIIKKAVNLLNENEYTKEPVAVGNSLCLIKLHKRYELTEKNIKEIVGKENSDRIIDFYKNKNLDSIWEQILKKRNIKPTLDNVLYKKNKDIVFTVDGENFTAEQLEDILKLFYSLKYGMPSTEKFSQKEKQMTSERIFKERLFASEAEKIKMNENAEFKRNWYYLKRATLAGAYKYNILMNQLLIDKEDIMKEYLLNKTTRYYKVKKVNNIDKKVFLPYNDVRVEIKNQLSRAKLKSLKKKWDNDILNEGKFRILNKDFLVN